MKLYYSQGSCSLASHIVLEELGLPFEAQRVNLREGEQRKPEFLAVNPKSKVPALVLDDGRVLTENPAILYHLTDLHPETNLIGPPGSWQRARTQEWLNWCSSTLHAGFFSHIINVGRIAEEPYQAQVKEKLKAGLAPHLELFDRALEGKRFLIDDQFSLADTYTIIFYRWSKNHDLAVGENWKRSVRAILERPAVQRALATQDVKIEI